MKQPARVFLDTNIVVALVEGGDPQYRINVLRAVSERASHALIFVSTQVMVETYNCCVRKLGLSVGASVEVVRQLLDYQVVGTDADLVMDGLRIADRNQISHWYALIVAAARRARCDELWTEGPQ